MLALWVGWVLASEPPPALEADSMGLEKGVLTATKGSIVDEKGVLSFEVGKIGLETGVLELEQVSIAFETGWFIRAERMDGVLNGEAVLKNATITACDCDCPVWELEAATLRVTTPDSAQLQDSAFQFGPLRLPLPDAEVPLEPEPLGMGLPGLGWELGDLRFDLPFVIRFRPGMDMELRPGWWRGPRLTGSLFVDQHTEAQWAVEWGEDFAALAQVEHAYGGGRWGSAVRGLWVDQPGTITRFGDYLTRQLPYTEQLARFWAGPLRLEGWAWQAEDDVGRWQVELVEPLWGLGPFTGDHALTMGLLRGHWRSELRAGMGVSETLGPLELRLRGDVRALDYDFLEQAVDASALTEGNLVWWAKHGAWHHELRLGAKALYSERVLDAMTPLSILDLVPGRSGWGPTMRGQWWGPGSADLEGWLRLSETGPAGWSVSGRYSYGELSLQAQSHWQEERGLHGASMHQSTELSEMWLGFYGQGGHITDLAPVLHAGARVGIPIESAVLWPTASALIIEDEFGTLSAGLHLESDCNCFLVGVDAGWSEDRDELTVGVAFDLLPKKEESSP